MVTTNFKPIQKTFTKVVEYLEHLEVLDVTDKKSGNQKSRKDKSENKTKSRPKDHESQNKDKGTNTKRKCCMTQTPPIIVRMSLSYSKSSVTHARW